jgi:glycosyltransferase involved in cell wall biosynthesis
VIGIRGFPGIQGGVEKHCEELCPRLSKLGYQIVVIARTPYIHPQKRQRQWNGIRFVYLWCPKRKQFETIIHSLFGLVVCLFKRPDIVHVHNIGPAWIIPVLRLFRIKTVLTYHSINYQHQKWGKLAKYYLRKCEKIGIKYANITIVISKTVKSFLAKKYSYPNLAYIPNGVTIPVIIPPGPTLKKFNLKPRKFIFTACRLVPEKGIHDLIEAFSTIDLPQYKLVVAGDSDYETDYSLEIKKNTQKIEGIVLTGSISGNPLKELFSNCGLFVLPSYHEGISIALLESMSYGLSVLVSDIPQNREIGLPDHRYFPPGNIDILKKKMKQFLLEGISNEEIDAQRILILKHHNWDDIAQKTKEIYNLIYRE